MPKDYFQEVDNTGRTKGSIRQAILIVLLLLTAALGYLYFFTGMIKPREQITAVAPARVAPLKQPLPPRADQGGMEQPAAVKPEDKQPGPAIAEKTATPPAAPETKPAAVPAPKPAVAPAPKPTVAPAPKPAQAPVQKSVKVEVKPVAKMQAKAPSVPVPANAQKETKTKPAKVTAGKADKIAKKQPAAAGKGTAKKAKFVLLAGEFASARETENARLKLEKHGLTDISVRKIKKDEPMHRLFLADFDSHEAAAAELRKLQPQTDSAFILNENGKYALYTGSYLHEKGAAAEQKRLARKGIKVTHKKVKVSLTISEVTAGSYSTSGDAKKEANSLKKKGIVVSVIKSGQ